MAESTEDRVKKVVADVLKDVLKQGAKEIKNNSHFIDDLGSDSLKNLELAVALEEEFGIDISDEEAAGLETVGKVVEFIKVRHQVAV